MESKINNMTESQCKHLNELGIKNLLLHVPHSSKDFPNGHTFEDLNEAERLLIDYYTDELFVPQDKYPWIESIIFKKCRLYCDVERLPHDPLERNGLGIVYHRKEEKNPPFCDDVYKAKLDYISHSNTVTSKLLRMSPRTLLIDCHSFSSQPTLLVPNPSNVDICIGFNEDWSKPTEHTIDTVLQYFDGLGYKVGVNTPFSNSKTFEVPVDYHSLMLEVNKRLYMDEGTCIKNEGFEVLRQNILQLYSILCENTEYC